MFGVLIAAALRRLVIVARVRDSIDLRDSMRRATGADSTLDHNVVVPGLRGRHSIH
jgi:hypothetical protein